MLCLGACVDTLVRVDTLIGVDTLIRVDTRIRVDTLIYFDTLIRFYTLIRARRTHQNIDRETTLRCIEDGVLH